MSKTLISRNIDDNTEVEIGDIERRSGLYILGSPGMGKSNLMELMILSDIQKGSGVFFLDPHGDAIEKIIKYLTLEQSHSLTILDPEDEKYSFGINPLACRDLASLKERTDTYTRAYNIFYKLWKNILDERPWLQLIVQNTLFALLENPTIPFLKWRYF